MALTRPFPVDKAWPNGIDLRRELGGILPREGVFPDPTIIAQGVAYKGSAWNVAARAFVAAARRGTAAFGQAYGTALIANDGAVAAAWVIPGAPGSGSRIDRLYVIVTDPTEGGALTTPGSETEPRAVPVFGIVSGQAGTSPQPPALPAGALPIARATVPASATSITGVTLAPEFTYAAPLGAAMLVPTIDALPLPAVLGERAFALDTGLAYQFYGTAWRRERLLCRATRTTDYNVGGSTVTGLIWQTLYGTADGFALVSNNSSPYLGSGIRVPESGLYLLTASLVAELGGADRFRDFFVSVNGVALPQNTGKFPAPHGTSGNVARAAFSIPLPLAANDVVTITTTGGSSATIKADSHVELTRIG